MVVTWGREFLTGGVCIRTMTLCRRATRRAVAQIENHLPPCAGLVGSDEQHCR